MCRGRGSRGEKPRKRRRERMGGGEGEKRRLFSEDGGLFFTAQIVEGANRWKEDSA